MADDSSGERTVRPPYASESVIRTFFEKMKNMGEPAEVDAKWVENYNFGGAQPHALIGMLKWLQVIDGSGRTCGVWSGLRTKQAETLAGLVRKAYAPVFEAVDVESADREALNGAFITAYASGTTDKPLKAFLTLCSVAEIETGVKKAGRRTPTELSTKRGPPATRNSATEVRRNAKTTTEEVGPISVTLNIEIPADWDGDRIRQRFQEVMTAIGSVD